MDRKLEEIFNECLEKIFQGGTIRDCLKEYPEYARDLKPLLEVAVPVRKVSNLTPDNNFKTSLKTRLLATAQCDKVTPVRITVVWRSAWFTALAVILLLVILTSGTVVAAGSTMPDGFLYPVKLASERVRLTFQSSTSAKLEYAAELANVRVTELIYEIGSNNVDSTRLDAAINRLNSVLIQIEKLANVNGDQTNVGQSTTLADVKDKEKSNLIKALALYAVTNSQILQDKMQVAPDTVKPAIENAINQTVDSFDKAIKAIEDQQTKS